MQKEYLSSFARRIGRGITPKKRQILSDILPKFLATTFSFGSIKNQKVILEIGFGNGKFCHSIASQNKENIFIGCEPYLNGIIHLLEKIIAENLQNIYLWDDDVRTLFHHIPNHTLDIIYILFPDPWPKRKQKKRRLINDYLLDNLAIKLKSNGIIKIATDDHDYAKWILLHFTNNPNFIWNNTNNWHLPFNELIQTSYYKKATNQGLIPYFFEFIRK
jgi:tRNA (guanine-N7-)-methyltransferase